MGIVTRLGSFTFLLLTTFVPIAGHGQQQDLSSVNLLANAPVSPAQEKQALVYLVAADEDLRLSVQQDRQRLKVGRRGELDVAVVQSSLAAAGIITSVVNLPVPGASLNRGAGIEPPSFPKYVDTGNPALDDQTYKAAKEAWVLAHQELYQQMTRASEDH